MKKMRSLTDILNEGLFGGSKHKMSGEIRIDTCAKGDILHCFSIQLKGNNVLHFHKTITDVNIFNKGTEKEVFAITADNTYCYNFPADAVKDTNMIIVDSTDEDGSNVREVFCVSVVNDMEDEAVKNAKEWAEKIKKCSMLDFFKKYKLQWIRTFGDYSYFLDAWTALSVDFFKETKE